MVHTPTIKKQTKETNKHTNENDEEDKTEKSIQTREPLWEQLPNHTTTIIDDIIKALSHSLYAERVFFV